MDSQNGNNTVGVKIYNIFIMIVDVIVLLVRFIINEVEAIIYMFMQTPEKDVKGQNVLITGTGHGIGRELALKYADAGATVIGWDINEKGNADTMKEIKARGGKFCAYVCDVSSRSNVLEMARKIRAEVGFVSIVINNAGIMPTHSLGEQTEAEIRKTFDINVLAHFWIMQAFLPEMIAENRGHFVALSSIAGLVGLKNLVPYCGSKFAVRGLMEAMSEELRADPRKPDIKFTTVFPYMVDTGLCKRPYMRFENLMPLVKPSDAAAAIMSGQRRGIAELSVPSYIFRLNACVRLFSYKSALIVRDFVDSGVESDL